MTHVTGVHGPARERQTSIKNPVDVARRAQIFSIVAQYCFSDKDLEYIDKVPDNIRDLWYLSFANSHYVMMHSKQLHDTKEYSRWYFPDKGSSPHIKYGQKIGLKSGESILDRYG